MGSAPFRRGERNPRADVHEQRAGMFHCHERRIPGCHRVADHDDRPADVLERLERRADAVCVRRLRIVERQVGRDRLVTARFEAVDQRLPAGAVVPVAVEEAIRRQVRKLGRAAEGPGRFEMLVVARHAEATERPEHEHDTAVDRLPRYRAEDATVL